MHKLAFPRSKKRLLLHISFGIVLISGIVETAMNANDLMNNNLLHLIPQVTQYSRCYPPIFIILFISLVGISLVGAVLVFTIQRMLGNLRLELTHTDHSSSGYETGNIFQPGELLRIHTMAFPISRKRYLFIALRRIAMAIPIIAVVLSGIFFYYLRNMSQTNSPCR